MMNADRHARPDRSAEFRFYEELNDFLPAGRRKVSFSQSFHGTPSVKDTIQAIGVPHSAIDLILVNGLLSTRFILDVHLGKLARYLRMLERIKCINPS